MINIGSIFQRASFLSFYNTKSRLNGFTLLEILVVLVLTSFITVLLFEGFSHVLHLRSQFLVQLDNLQRGVLQEYWFQSTNATIITDYTGGKHIFKGNQQRFSGLTIGALDRLPGVPTPFAWELKYADGIMKLYYQNSKGEYWEITHWFSNKGHFRYMAKDGKWHTQWPPRLGRQHPQIPRIIQLQGQRRQTPITWMVKLPEHDITKIDSRLQPIF